MAKFSIRTKLTERSAEGAQPTTAVSKKGHPCAKLYLHTQQPGFGLSVAASGAKSYFVYRRVNGQQVKFTFRKFGEVPLAQARGEAEQLFAKMGGGVNPIEERRKARAEAKRKEASGITLRAGIDLYE